MNIGNDMINERIETVKSKIDNLEKHLSDLYAIRAKLVNGTIIPR